MIYIIIVLFALLVASSIYMIYYKRQIKNISDQLNFVLEHQSFKFIRTDIRPKEIMNLVANCNTLLESSRELDRNYLERNEVINQTIVSLSHDIRTPLTSLDGYLQLASRQSSDNEYITMASSRVKQLNKLVDELFLYTKLQNPDYELDLETIDISPFITRELFEFHNDFQKISTEPIINLPDKKIMVSINTHALERVINNVIKNYFDHGQDELEIQHHTEDREVTITFKNAVVPGAEINSKDLFTKFYKTDRSRSDQTSGLGLSIIESLMTKMNGKVNATVENGMFSIHLTFKRLDT